MGIQNTHVLIFIFLYMFDSNCNNTKASIKVERIDESCNLECWVNCASTMPAINSPSLTLFN